MAGGSGRSLRSVKRASFKLDLTQRLSVVTQCVMFSISRQSVKSLFSVLFVVIVGLSSVSSSATPPSYNYPPGYRDTDFPIRVDDRRVLVSPADAARWGIVPFWIQEFGFPVEYLDGIRHRPIPRIDNPHRLCFNQQIDEIRKFIEIVKQPRYNYVRHLAKSGFGFGARIIIAPSQFPGVFESHHMDSPRRSAEDHLRYATYPAIFNNSYFGYPKEVTVRTFPGPNKTCHLARAWDIVTHLAMVSNCVARNGAANCAQSYQETTPPYTGDPNLPGWP